tara:strand:+ start:451 stop:666 length:216 start_codon:yes stop_codon:yes gene_type:complete
MSIETFTETYSGREIPLTDRPIENNEKWKLYKAHPSWRPDLSDRARNELWQSEYTPEQRLSISDYFGERWK